MGGEEKRMRLEKKMHPRRQAKRCTHKSKPMVAQNVEELCVAAMFALFLFSVLVLPHIMYYLIAPMKGWC